MSYKCECHQHSTPKGLQRRRKTCLRPPGKPGAELGASQRDHRCPPFRQKPHLTCPLSLTECSAREALQLSRAFARPAPLFVRMALKFRNFSRLPAGQLVRSQPRGLAQAVA